MGTLKGSNGRLEVLTGGKWQKIAGGLEYSAEVAPVNPWGDYGETVVRARELGIQPEELAQLFEKLEQSLTSPIHWAAMHAQLNPAFTQAMLAAAGSWAFPDLMAQAEIAAEWEASEYRRRALRSWPIYDLNAYAPASLSGDTIRSELRMLHTPIEATIEYTPEGLSALERARKYISEQIDETLARATATLLGKSPAQRDRELLEDAGRAFVEGIKAGINKELPSFNRFWADNWSHSESAPAYSTRRAKRREQKQRIEKRLKAKNRG
jgi:hypothetical protein